MALNIDYKPERHPIRWIILIIILLLLAAGGWFAYKWYTTGNLPLDIPIASANNGVNETNISNEDIKNYTVPNTHPRYLSIASLNLSKARVYSVGLDANNLIEAPSNIHDISWYNKSGTPGDGGVVLMNAHNRGVNKNGAFYGIADLKKDDLVTVERGDGEIFRYGVVKTKTMSLDEFNSEGLTAMGKSAESGIEALNLITFNGKWVPRLGTFDQRTIVWTTLVDDK